MKPVKIVFLKVQDNQRKAQAICYQVQEILKKEKRLLILVPNEEAAKYVDLLLWRFPEDSFIPHILTQHPVEDWVVITANESQNLNSAHCLLNLNTHLSPIYHQFEEIYELYDETHSQKAQLAQKKIQEYQNKGLAVTQVRCLAE